MVRRPFGKNYVRVRFVRGGKAYVYYCPEARKGDAVNLPPSRYAPYVQTRKVVGYGRRLFWGKVKTARLHVPGPPPPPDPWPCEIDPANYDCDGLHRCC